MGGAEPDRRHLLTNRSTGRSFFTRRGAPLFYHYHPTRRAFLRPQTHTPTCSSARRHQTHL
nr:MAG TPA: hypothetical protein [Caudoviricetes sp.]